MIVTCREMAAAEERLFSEGVDPEPFMDKAGRRCAEAVRFFYPSPGHADVAVGKGNNGGDALVVARWLKRWGWKVDLHFSHGPDQLSQLGTKKLAEFETEPSSQCEQLDRNLVLIDGLLGIGARGELRGGIREQADRLNRRRVENFGVVFAIDIPTGLDGDTGEAYGGAVIADVTLSITAAKAGFAADGAESHVGRLVEIPLDIPVEGDTSISFLFASDVRSRLPRRSFAMHKGDAGRVALVAGSKGLSGAAVLAALGASNGGAGLTTLFVTEGEYENAVCRCPAEVMVRPYRGFEDIYSIRPDAIGIGPGLGSNVPSEMLAMIREFPGPMVVDADALNALSRNHTDFSTLPGNRILTPHPGEMARMTSECGSRIEKTRKLADQWGLTLLHKGSRTAIASPGRVVELNTTGHAGMASGGMGDVLTGVCTALLAQGVVPHDAACIGSWLIGRAAESVRDSQEIAAESVTASAMAACLGAALRDLQTGCP